MIIFDDILSFFNPDNFMPIYVITWVVLVVGYLLLGFNVYVVVAAVMAIWVVFTSLGVHPMAFATKLPLYGIIIVAVVYSGKVGEPDLIQDKSQAQVIKAVIPDREIRIHRFARLPLTSHSTRYNYYLKRVISCCTVKTIIKTAALLPIATVVESPPFIIMMG